MKNHVLIIVTIVVAFLFSCDQTKLTNEEAKALIVKTLNLPVSYRHDINKRPSMGSGFELDGLREAGLITGSETLDIRRPIEINVTEIGKPSFLGESNDAYMFKTNDIDFDQITGISINKQEQTATIRFTLKAKNVTLAGYALANTSAGFSGKKYINYSLVNPLSGELVFKKFDNGWQLLDQSKSGSDLLNLVLDAEVNSNEQDDYTSQIDAAKVVPKPDGFISIGTIESQEYFKNLWVKFIIATPSSSKIPVIVTAEETSVYLNDEKIFWDDLKVGMKIGINGSWGEDANGKYLSADRIDILQ
jgi:hypothetical protein